MQVAKPRLGENHPARVRADITILLSTRYNIRNEWEGLRKHDVAFLVTVRPTNTTVTKYNYKVSGWFVFSVRAWWLNVFVSESSTALVFS